MKCMSNYLRVKIGPFRRYSYYLTVEKSLRSKVASIYKYFIPHGQSTEDTSSQRASCNQFCCWKQEPHPSGPDTVLSVFFAPLPHWQYVLIAWKNEAALPLLRENMIISNHLINITHETSLPSKCHDANTYGPCTGTRSTSRFHTGFKARVKNSDPWSTNH